MNQLEPVFSGDFSWQDQLDAHLQMQNLLLRYVLSDLAKNSPIWKKFSANDPSWLTDLEIHLRSQNIDLVKFYEKKDAQKSKKIAPWGRFKQILAKVMRRSR